MLEKLLQKRNIFSLLLGLSLALTAITAILGLDFRWWGRGSIFFSITTIAGIYIGQLTTAYKVRHLLETQVDDLINDLAIPKMTRIDDPDLESGAFFTFAKGLLALLCEDFDYDGGVISVFEKSLRPTFTQTYLHHRKSTLSLTRDDFKLFDEICGKSKNGTNRLVHSSGVTYSIRFSGDSMNNEERELNDNSQILDFKYVKLIPITLMDDYLGYIALFKRRTSSFLDEIIDFIQVLSEKATLQQIENKKIDDAMKNFLVRQLILQVLLTIRYLDEIHDDLHSVQSCSKLAERIVEVIRGCWNFNGCLIRHSDGDVVQSFDDSVKTHLIRSKLIPRINQRLEREPDLQFYKADAAQVFRHDEQPGFVQAFALKLEKGNDYFGYLIVTADRELTDFEMQVMPIFENYKIDDCYQELALRLSNKT